MSQWITAITQKIEDWASEKEIVYKFAEKYYRDVVQKEIVLAAITEGDSILCIGGGICPFSAILFHQATGAKITVIDNNTCCVSKAKQVIDRLNLNEHVTVLHQDGRSTDISFSAYTVVHFALQTQPMECVFSHVEKNVTPGTKLLVRRPKKRLKNLYSQLPMLHHCPFTVHSAASNIGSTMLYIKEDPHEGKPETMAPLAVGGASDSAAYRYPVAV